MLRHIALAVALLIPLAAQASPASPQSIEVLLQLSRTEQLMESMYPAVEQMMRQASQQTVSGKPMNPDQQRMLDALPAKFTAILREEMNWTKLKPFYVKIYGEVFEQEEVDGLIAFYRSPVGQSSLDKIPVVMQKSLALSQSLMQSLIPRMQAAAAEALEEAKVGR